MLMNRLNVLLILYLLVISCEKSDPDFNTIADDNLIYPDIVLSPSNWIKLDSLTESTINDLSFCNENTGIINGFNGTVFLTRNGGANWKKISTNALMTFLAVYSLDEYTFLTARAGLYKSTDYGSTWHKCNLSSDFSIFDIWFKNPQEGFFSCGSGTYRSTDSGESWRKISNDIAQDIQFTSTEIGYFSYGYSSVSKSSTQALSSNGDIFRTTNGGKTWRKMELNMRGIYHISFISDKIGFFTTDDGYLYKTIDGGESCTLIGKKDFYIYDLFFVNENQGMICTNLGIMITLDGGNTFTFEYKNSDNRLILKFDFPIPKIGYAVGNGGLLFKRIQK
jgi:photosystem II stability/assembly factor-like uncharacterized protein